MLNAPASPFPIIPPHESSYSPEQIAVLQRALDDAWQRTLSLRPPLALLGPRCSRIRELLAVAVLEAAANGVTDFSELSDFAVRVVPRAR